MTQESNTQNYSPWMDNWNKDYKNPKKATKSWLSNPSVKILFWIGFFGLLVSPFIILVVVPLMSSSGVGEYKPAGITNNDVKRLIEQTESAIFQCDYDTAIQQANYLISEKSDIPRIYVLAGYAYFMLQDYTEASEFAYEALKINPKYVAAQCLQAMCSYKINPFAPSSDLQIETMDDRIYSFFLYTSYQILRHDFSGMLVTAQSGVKSYPKSHLLAYNLARAQYLNFQIFDSLSTVDKMTKSDLDYDYASDAIWMRASMLKIEILRKLGKTDEAWKQLMTFYEKYPYSWATISVYADILNSQGKFEKTIGLLSSYKSPKTAVGKNFDVIRMYQLRGEAYFEEKNYTDSIDDYKNIVIIEAGVSDFDSIEIAKEYFTPICHLSLLRIAKIELINGNIDEGKKLYDLVKTIYLSPDEQEEYNQLGNELN